jgi:hypothetical protein
MCRQKTRRCSGHLFFPAILAAVACIPGIRIQLIELRPLFQVFDASGKKLLVISLIWRHVHPADELEIILLVAGFSDICHISPGAFSVFCPEGSQLIVGRLQGIAAKLFAFLHDDVFLFKAKVFKLPG